MPVTGRRAGGRGDRRAGQPGPGAVAVNQVGKGVAHGVDLVDAAVESTIQAREVDRQDLRREGSYPRRGVRHRGHHACRASAGIRGWRLDLLASASGLGPISATWYPGWPGNWGDPTAR